MHTNNIKIVFIFNVFYCKETPHSNKNSTYVFKIAYLTNYLREKKEWDKSPFGSFAFERDESDCLCSKES